MLAKQTTRVKYHAANLEQRIKSKRYLKVRPMIFMVSDRTRKEDLGVYHLVQQTFFQVFGGPELEQRLGQLDDATTAVLNKHQFI